MSQTMGFSFLHRVDFCQNNFIQRPRWQRSLYFVLPSARKWHERAANMRLIAAHYRVSRTYYFISIAAFTHDSISLKSIMPWIRGCETPKMNLWNSARKNCNYVFALLNFTEWQIICVSASYFNFPSETKIEPILREPFISPFSQRFSKTKRWNWLTF